jgi:hypothetical protein
MAVTFTSHGYDTTTGNPYTEVAWSDAHPPIGASTYGVRSGGDWKVTAVTGADRTVSIAPGFGWGHGVTDVTATNDTIQLDTISSGSRWDLIVARRDWTPTAGETKFMKINGGATKAIPGGRLSGNGAIDDQPLALVQVTAGQTQPTAIVDLRCWARNGGVAAKDDLVKGYLTDLGTEVYINGIEWRYVPGANDVPEWTTSTSVTTYAPVGNSKFTVAGSVNVTPEGLKRRVTVDIMLTRIDVSVPIETEWNLIASVLPAAAQGSSIVKYFPVTVVGVSNNGTALLAFNPASGGVSIRGITPFTLQVGSVIGVNLSYYI